VYWTNPVFKDGGLERMGLNGLISLAGLAVKDISPFKNPIFKIRFLLISGKNHIRYSNFGSTGNI
jgi:hypothetical protein